MTFSRSEQDEDSTTEKDDYGDDDFELDHTMVEEDKKFPPSYSRARDGADEKLSNKSEESFVSEFDKMKVGNYNGAGCSCSLSEYIVLFLRFRRHSF